MKTASIIALFSLGVLGQTGFGQTHHFRLPANYDNGIDGKWEFRFALGGQIGTKHDQAILADLGVGYNVSNNLYLGVATGYYPYFGVVDGLNSEAYLPLMGDVTLRWNLEEEHISPFVELRGGYLLPTKSEGFLEGTNDAYTRQGYTALEVGPGLSLRAGRSIDVRMSVNYALALPGADGFEPELNCQEHLVQVRFGMAFRGKAKGQSRAKLIEMHEQQLQAENERRQQEYLAQQRAAEEEAERRVAEEREERRRRREAETQKTMQQIMGTSDESPYEFYFHVTPGMVKDGARLENQLINLAAMAAGKQLSSIVVLGYDVDVQDNFPNVAEAMNQANKVKAYLTKRYVIDKNLFSIAYSGFENSSGQDTRPKDAIATIIIQKKPTE